MDIYKEIYSVFRVNPGLPLPIGTGQRYGDRKLLAELCRRMGYTLGAELGVRDGRFAELFCQAGLEMWCVDPWSPVPNYSLDRQEHNYKEATDRLQKYNVHFIRKVSSAALDDVPNGLEFLHIDGRHEFDFVMLDLLQWCPKVRPGGVIACHDYHLSGVKWAIEAYTAAHHIDPWFVLKNHQPTAFWVQP